jgi:hypothetical protein
MNLFLTSFQPSSLFLRTGSPIDNLQSPINNLQFLHLTFLHSFREKITKSDFNSPPSFCPALCSLFSFLFLQSPTTILNSSPIVPLRSAERIFSLPGSTLPPRLHSFSITNPQSTIFLLLFVSSFVSWKRNLSLLEDTSLASAFFFCILFFAFLLSHLALPPFRFRLYVFPPLSSPPSLW